MKSNFEAFLALEASAGSGKTFALSLRFVSLVLMGAKIDEILAITFTKKAANEMKRRVIDTFLNFDKQGFEAHLNELCLILGKEKQELCFLRDKYKEKFLRSKLKIQTFDSFFTQIVRVFALNLGLMSDFNITQEEEDIKDIFIKRLGNKKIKDLAKHIISTNESKASFFENLDFLYKNSCDLKSYDEKESLDIKNIQNAYDKLKNYALDKVENKNYKANFDIDDVSKNLKKLCEKPLINDTNKKYFKTVLEDEKFINLREALIKEINEYCLKVYKIKINTLLSFLDIYSKTKDDINRDKNTLSFNDISTKALELTQNIDKEMIYFRLDSKISHLLIDEFQDTNILQYKILKPIISELVSGKGVKDFRSFFYVGDKKQSIYKFRNTQKELFDLLQSDFKQIKKQILDTNYRSKQEIVSFVNDIFSKAYEGFGQDFYPQKCMAGCGGFVSVISKLEQDDIAIKDSIFEEILKQVLILQEKNVKLNEICVLCWKNEDADDLVFFLKEKGIQAFTQSNIELEKKSIVFALLEFAKYCIFGDEFYAEELRALGFENFTRLKIDMSKSPMQTLFYLAQKLKLDLSDMSLLQFIEYASSKENFLELLFNPCELKIQTEQSFGISVMTVHKSKGLEFKTVILIDSISSGRNKNAILEYDIKKGFELEFRNDLRAFTGEPKYKAFREKHDFLQRLDDLNKLYVAFTRACENLIIIKRERKDEKIPRASQLFILPLQEMQKGVLNKKEKEQDLRQEFTKEEALQAFVKLPTQEEKLINKNTKETYFGMALHYALEFINFSSSDDTFIYQRLKNTFHHYLDDFAFYGIKKRCEMLKNDTTFKELLKGKKLFREQKFVFDKELRQLDLLAVDEKEAFIFDYKSSKNELEKNLEQVNFYKNAVSSLLQGKTIRAFIVFCLENEINIQEV